VILEVSWRLTSVSMLELVVKKVKVKLEVDEYLCDRLVAEQVLAAQGKSVLLYWLVGGHSR